MATAAARFEDLTIQNAYVVGIDASAADIALQRATIDNTSAAPVSYGVRGDGSLAIVDSVISGTRSNSGNLRRPVRWRRDHREKHDK